LYSSNNSKEAIAMLSSDDGFSLLHCIRPAGSINIRRVLECLYDVEDECHIDEASLLSCLNAKGGLDTAKFLQLQEDSS